MSKFINTCNCKYVDVIPFRNGNEYDETYRCAVTGKSCNCGECKLTEGEAERLFNERMNLKRKCGCNG